MVRTAATVILVSSANKILMQLRDDGSGKMIPYPNTWNFPGGQKEEQESHLECAVREIKEEFGVDIAPMQCKQIFCYDHDVTKDEVVFMCAVQGEPRLELHEGAAIEWMTLDTIKGLKLAFEQENIIPYIEQYLNRLTRCE